MQTSTALLVTVGTLIAVAGVLAFGGLVASARLGTSVGQPRGRAAALVGLGAVGVLVGILGSLFQAYTVQVGGSSGTAAGTEVAGVLQASATLPGAAASAASADAASSAAGGAAAGFAFPLGALTMLAVLAGLLFVAAKRLRAPSAVAVPACGWLAVVGVLMYGGADNGDVILAASASAQLFLYGGLILAAGFLVLVYQWQLSDQLAKR